MYMYICICVYIYISLSLSIYLSIYLSISISLSLYVCMYVCIYIYIYILHACHRPRAHRSAMRKRSTASRPPVTVSSHNLPPQHFKLRVSNPTAIAYFYFKLPFETSNLPVAGPIFPH